MEMGPLERFVEENAEKAYCYAMSLCGNESEARELTQAAFVRFLERGDPGADPAQSRSWLYTVVRNLYYDLQRGWERRRGVPVQTVVGDDGMTLADAIPHGGEAALLDALERREELDRLRAVLQGLPEEAREILVLVDMNGAAYEEAAKVLGVPLGTVRSRLSRARETLKGRMLAKETKR